MTVKLRKLAAAILLAAPVCYSMAQGQAINTPGSIGQRVTYTPEHSIPMSNFKKTVTTVFWVGEGASAENGHIDNYGSYWDARWMKHFGGVDNPEKRNGFHPAGFKPKQNPFYVALPFAEVDRNGNLKEIAKNIPGFGTANGPLTRNRWVEIRYKGKSCFAQWQDVGPSGEDDFDWVFGDAAKPKNKFGLRAGLDISPATAQWLDIEDSARTEWRFVDASAVPDGPWKDIVTR
ncbi:MAG: hypothetical protein ACLPPF_04040 [Rhodomicrobium sp.]